MHGVDSRLIFFFFSFDFTLQLNKNVDSHLTKFLLEELLTFIEPFFLLISKRNNLSYLNKKFKN